MGGTRLFEWVSIFEQVSRQVMLHTIQNGDGGCELGQIHVKICQDSLEFRSC